MSIKSDKWIRRMCEEHRMIEPFETGQVRDEKISYGLSSYGYDIRVSSEFKVFTNVHNSLVDPKNFDDRSFVDIAGPECIIPPNSFALARTEEYFRIPRDVLVLHPGPMNRGVEIDSDVADGPHSVILNQVTNGVAIRMAVLYLLAGGRQESAEAAKQGGEA